MSIATMSSSHGNIKVGDSTIKMSAYTLISFVATHSNRIDLVLIETKKLKISLIIIAISYGFMSRGFISRGV
jgi:hypothetical protein